MKKVTQDTETLNLNTAVAQMMIFVNEATSAGTLPRETLETFLKILSPYAPHICEELWEKLGHKEFICRESWPEWDETLCQEDTITVVVMVNGKKRDELQVAKGLPRDELQKIAMESPKAAKFIEGKKPRKVIVVPDKLVNVVV